MPPNESMELKFFRSKVEAALLEQAARRNLAVEGKGSQKKKLYDYIQEHYGVGIPKMHMGQLNRLSREMGDVLEGFLGGEKRLPAPGARLPAGFAEFVEAEAG